MFLFYVKVELENFKTNLKGFVPLTLHLLYVAVLQGHSVSIWGEPLDTISLSRWSGKTSHIASSTTRMQLRAPGCHCLLGNTKESGSLLTLVLAFITNYWNIWKNSIIFWCFLNPAKICQNRSWLSISCAAPAKFVREQQKARYGSYFS